MVAKTSPLPDDVLSSIEEGALLNATKHGGKAQVGAVMARILAEFPGLRTDPGRAAQAVRKKVDEVNRMTPAEQDSLLLRKYPEAAERVPKEGRVGLPPLPNAARGKTSFRLPPEPSGFMTIGHAMAFTINFLYKQQYDGELWLRFEDTNPRKVASIYYDNFRKGIEWLSIQCDHEKNVSDDMELIYEYGRKLIDQGSAYACSCDEARVKRLRFEGTACEHRTRSVESSLRVWDELLAKRHSEGDYVIRFMGDMASPNYSLRDTNLFRVIDHPHPLTGSKYSLWPTYDLANAVEDEVCGTTHILRSSEFRNELQQQIREVLKFRRLEVIQFSRFNFKGAPVAKRLLRPLVEKKLVSGWDDPRMPTVDGIRRRGIIPQAIRDFTLLVGYTKTEHEYDWSMLMSINRRLLDPTSRRLFFVPDPVRLVVEGAPKKRASVPFHPQSDLGKRTFETTGEFFVPRADLKSLRKGNRFRLMDLYNVQLTSAGKSPKAKYAGNDLDPTIRKFQWVIPSHVEAKVFAPGALFTEKGEFNSKSMTELLGFAEESLSTVRTGEIVQFPRVGFCRLDSPGTFFLSA